MGEGAHFLGRCLGMQTWHTNAQIMDITGFYGSDHGSRPWSVLVFSCLMESPAAMLGDLRACLLCPSRWVAPLSLSSAALEQGLVSPGPTANPVLRGGRGGGEQGPWPGPRSQWQFLPLLTGLPAYFLCLPGFGPAHCEALVPRVYTLLLLGASCLGRLSVTCLAVAVHSQFPRPPRSSSSAP